MPTLCRTGNRIVKIKEWRVKVSGVPAVNVRAANAQKALEKASHKLLGMGYKNEMQTMPKTDRGRFKLLGKR